MVGGVGGVNEFGWEVRFELKWLWVGDVQCFQKLKTKLRRAGRVFLWKVVREKHGRLGGSQRWEGVGVHRLHCLCDGGSDKDQSNATLAWGTTSDALIVGDTIVGEPKPSHGYWNFGQCRAGWLGRPCVGGTTKILLEAMENHGVLS